MGAILGASREQPHERRRGGDHHDQPQGLHGEHERRVGAAVDIANTAVALMMDVLSGVLTGSGFGSGVAGPYEAGRRSGAGHLFVALHVEAFLAPEAFDARMEELVAEVTSGPRAEGVEEILYPGAPEARNDERQRRHGLELAQRTLLDLERLARETGTPFPFHTI